MEDRNTEILQRVFDFETARCGDILEINAAKYRLDQPAGLDDLGRILGVEADRPGIDLGEFTEQQRLAFHHWQCRLGADITQAEHGRAVAHHGNRISLDGQFPRLIRILGNDLAGPRDARRIGER